MNRLFASILILVVLLGTFGSWFAFAEYEWNKDYIAENLCINKDRPELNCNGFCYLKTQLEKVDKSMDLTNEIPQKPIQEETRELVYTFDDLSFSFINVFGLHEKTEIVYLNHYSFRLIDTHYNPPRA